MFAAGSLSCFDREGLRQYFSSGCFRYYKMIFEHLLIELALSDGGMPYATR